MKERHSIAEARSNLPRLVREAESGNAVELTRRGEPVAVLIGHREYARLTGRTQSFAQAYRGFREQFDVAELGIDPDEVFGTARDRTAGRDTPLA